ncbi:Hypothetical predicted protein, partial [Paramuricea clavata]
MGPSRKIISFLFRVLDEFTICKGFPVDSKFIIRDIKENVNGITEQWRIPANDNGAVEEGHRSVLFHRSTGCNGLHQANYKRSSQALCDHCTLLKRNSSVLPQNNEFTETKRERYMSGAELKEKIRRE